MHQKNSFSQYLMIRSPGIQHGSTICPAASLHGCCINSYNHARPSHVDVPWHFAYLAGGSRKICTKGCKPGNQTATRPAHILGQYSPLTGAKPCGKALQINATSRTNRKFQEMSIFAACERMP